MIPSSFRAALILLALAGCAPAADPSPSAQTPAARPPATASASVSASASAAPAFAYPAARTVDAADTFQGKVVADPYRWLEDEKADDVKAWTKAEDELAREHLASVPERDGLTERLTALRYIDALDAPLAEGKRVFQRRRVEKMEKSAVFVRDDAKAERRALLDPNAWPAKPPTSLGDYRPSPDGRRVAYEKALNNADDTVLEVMDVASGKVEERIEGLLGAEVRWAAKGDAFYYVRCPPDRSMPEAERFMKSEIRRHVLGDEPEKDAIVRPAVGTAGDYELAEESRDGHWLLVHRERGAAKTSVYVRRADRPKDPWITLADGDTKATAFAYKDRIYLLTNEGAPRFRLARVDAAKASARELVTVVPERAGATLERAQVVGGRLVLVWMVDAAHRLEVRDLDGTNARDVALPELDAIEDVEGREDAPVAHVVVSSFARPPELWSLDVATAKVTLEERPKADLDPGAYAVEQMFATSKDGTKVPAFVARRRETPKDGARPTVVFGYGGFGLSRTPKFDANAVAWMDRGGVWILAALRGGGEYGEAWHLAGRRTHKQNVFDDYYAVAEEAVRAGWTKPAHLAAMGRSNGGLLVGAAVTQRPDLWGAALSAVPLMDMIRMRLTGNGASWVDEYGSPDDPAELAALLAYSPYHNIAADKTYPPVLVASSDADARVDPMHARKFVARMQKARGGPVLLRVESDAGHAGADGVKRAIDRFAEQLAFLWHHTS